MASNASHPLPDALGMCSFMAARCARLVYRISPRRAQRGAVKEEKSERAAPLFLSGCIGAVRPPRHQIG